MTSTRFMDLVSPAVKVALGRLGPGLYGVACSGGADSIALARAAIEVAGPAHVVVLTIDHGLSPGSGAVAAEVARWARAHGAAAVVHRVEVSRRASVEAAARAARYAALDELADLLGVSAVLLGHTARDQAETVLMRVLRGTGPAGLAGIPARRGRFVRPLLALPRAAIDAFVAARALPTWADPMNDDVRIARVRIRTEVLPMLRRENPQLDTALVRLADSAAEWLEVIDARARPFARFPMSCARLAQEPAAIRKRAVSLALEAAGLDYDAVHLAQIDRVVTGPPRGEVTIEIRDGRLVRSYDELRPALRTLPAASPLRAPDGPYELRAWRPGDRMKPIRLRGRTRKLSDLFIDAKLPRALREQARVLVRTTDGVIVWAEHVGLACGAAETLTPRPA